MGGFIFKTYQIPMLLLSGLWVIDCFRMGRIVLRQLVVLFCYISALIYSMLIVIAFDWQDTLIIEYILYGVLLSTAAAKVVAIYKNKYFNYQDVLLWDIYIAGVIHAGIMILLFLSKDMQSVIYEFLVLSDKGSLFVEHGTRSPGLTTGGGSALSVAQVAVMICGFCCWNFRPKLARVCKSFSFEMLCVGSGILVLSIAISGRSGFLILSIFIASLFFLSVFGLRKARRLMWGVFSVFLSLGALFVISYSFFDLGDYLNFKWVFEAYYNYQATGNVSTKSTDIIFNTMYFLPDNAMDVIFGTSNLGRGETLPYIESDVGYVRLIYAVGVVGTILIFLPNIYFLLMAISSRKTMVNILVIILTSIQIIMNFKELFIVLVQGWTFIYFLIVWSDEKNSFK